MPLSRYEFEVLRYLEEQGAGEYPIRHLSDTLCLSGNTVLQVLDTLQERQFLLKNGAWIRLTEAGLEALEPYRVKRAIILAAGFGSRMMPATKDRPKPMVTVNGVRILDTLLDALVAADIRDITIIGGYCFDKLHDLLEKYPFVNLIENRDYNSTNNISSAMLALPALHDGCYLCEADLYITNPQVITKYQYASNILGSYSLETDDWSFKMVDGYAADYKKGNTYCYNYYGISYWTPEDCEKLKRDFAEVFHSPGGKNYFWEFIPLVLKKDDYQVEIRPCRKQDIMEIDNYYELAQLDESYRREGEDRS